MIVFDFGLESDSEVEVRNYQFKPARARNYSLFHTTKIAGL